MTKSDLSELRGRVEGARRRTDGRVEVDPDAFKPRISNPNFLAEELARHNASATFGDPRHDLAALQSKEPLR